MSVMFVMYEKMLRCPAHIFKHDAYQVKRWLLNNRACQLIYAVSLIKWNSNDKYVCYFYIVFMYDVLNIKTKQCKKMYAINITKKLRMFVIQKFASTNRNETLYFNIRIKGPSIWFPGGGPGFKKKKKTLWKKK